MVYATDLLPDKVGLIAGSFFGLMFGLGGLGSAFCGWLADKTSIEFIFQVSAFLPLLGIIAGFLPNTPVSYTHLALEILMTTSETMAFCSHHRAGLYHQPMI